MEKALYSVKVGMSETEVDRIMSRYIKLKDVPQGSSPMSSGPSGGFTGVRRFRRPPQGPSNDADRGIVHFRDGRVTRIEFSPD